MIRVATLEDAALLARINVETWQDAYRGILDADFLARMSVARFEERWRERLDREDPITFLYGEVGYISGGTMRPESGLPGDAEVYAVYVHPRAQGQGVGRALFETVSDHLRQQGFKEMALWVFKENLAARRFYEKMGGTLCGEQDLEIEGVVYREVGYLYDLSENGSRPSSTAQRA